MPVKVCLKENKICSDCSEAIKPPVVTHMNSNHMFVAVNGMAFFYSYTYLTGIITKDKIYLNKATWNYSRTTVMYRNTWLNMTTDEVKLKVANGEIELVEMEDV